jgi:putative toxin-antitoxin system antitoxin component (TIGR02293 family)
LTLTFGNTPPIIEHIANNRSRVMSRPAIEAFLAQVTSPELSDRVASARALRDGLSTVFVQELEADGIIDLKALIEAEIMPQRTWTHARKAGHLSSGGAQRIARYVRASVLARETFGPDRAMTWMTRANAALQGESPIALLDSDDGARAVETLIGRIAHGIAA